MKRVQAMRDTRDKGFTIVELMIVMVIVGILISMAIPSFKFMFSKDKLRSSTTTVTAMLYTARMKAMNEGEPYGVLFEESGRCLIVCDPADTNLVVGPPSFIEDGVNICSIDFTDRTVIFNEFGQLEKSCLPTGILTGTVKLANDAVDTTAVEVTYLTGRIRERNL